MVAKDMEATRLIQRSSMWVCPIVKFLFKYQVMTTVGWVSGPDQSLLHALNN